MLRSIATRSLLKSFPKVPIARSSYSAASIKFRTATPLHQLNNNRPQVRILIARPTTTSLLYATTKAGLPVDKIDPKAEHKLAKEHIEPHPSEVSGESSVRHVFEQGQAPKSQDDEMLGAIKADLGTIKETFSLAEVPKESLYIGAAGVIPYAATSLSTVFLAYDINQAHATGHGIVFSPETAHQLLEIITPIQIGYGAVVGSQSSRYLSAFAEAQGRLFLSLEQSTGVLNTLDTEDTTAIVDTCTESLPQQLRGQQYSCRSNTP
jgi:hypothetical protein